jgi:hypothetical protein
MSDVMLEYAVIGFFCGFLFHSLLNYWLKDAEGKHDSG